MWFLITKCAIKVFNHGSSSISKGGGREARRSLGTHGGKLEQFAQ